MQETAGLVARHLLETGAVFLRPDDPFTWASGIISPIYCDNRLILTSPAARADIERCLADLVREQYPDAQVLMGTSTAGIPHAAIAAHILNLPMGYVRAAAKDHGRTNRIEGRLEPGERAVVVEDLISTAGSAVDTALALREAGADVLGLVSIFSYGMKKAADRLAEADLVCHSLCTLDALVEVAAGLGAIAPGDRARILRFRDNPDDPGWRA